MYNIYKREAAKISVAQREKISLLFDEFLIKHRLKLLTLLEV
jgi:hypothetical protein